MQPAVIYYLHIVYSRYYYRGKYCMKIFYEDLKKHATKIINYEKKEKENSAINKVCCACKKKPMMTIKIPYGETSLSLLW